MRKLTDAAAGRRDLGARIFSFAVVADTHVNQEEGKASSDFAVNRLSNARNRRVLHELNRAHPAFVLHLGDIVHPTPSHPEYAKAAAAFHELAAVLNCPLYLTPGNHDVGDKPGDWLPVPSVSEPFLDLYRQHFGEHYFSFDSHGCHFIVIDAQIINSGLASEAAQRSWLERDLQAHAGARTFLCSHYPPFLLEPGEESHYDNLDEPGRAWLLDLLAKHKPEALFAGHVHNFWYHLHGDTEIYLLPSTAFVRLDYSELFRIEPAPERGRNDAGKLGFMIIDVHERSHVAHTIRSYGVSLAPGEALADERKLAPVHPKSIVRPLLGIDLRHPWAETMEVAASGALDEFSRKPARNDYPVMALWEMGIRRLRVPLADLCNPQTRERMRALQRCGQTFTVYTHEVPPGAAREALIAHAGLIVEWEVIAPLHRIDAVAEQVARVKAHTGLPVTLSKLRRPDDAHHHGLKARHAIEHGFQLAEQEQIRTLLTSGTARAAFDAFLFRISHSTSASDQVVAIGHLARSLDRKACHGYVRLAGDNPAQARDDDLANANLVAESMLAALVYPDVQLWLDTLDDFDRGYFPRSGLVDRRYNPRLAGHVVRNLHAAVASDAAAGGSIEERSISLGRLLIAASPAVCWVLLLPDRKGVLEAFPWALRESPASVEWIDLAGGRIEAIRCKRMAGSNAVLELHRPLEVLAPTLFRIPCEAG